MKAGILTLPFGSNYGGILQNWALQQALMKSGHSPVTIMHQRPGGRIGNVGNALRQAATDFVGLNLPAMGKIKPIEPSELMQGFIDKHIICTPNLDVFRSKDIEHFGLDAIIVGSDQVWRRGYNVFTQEMYLRFLKTDHVKRIAYAASFGNSEWNYPGWLTKLCRHNLRKFHAVSCREYSGAEFCKEHFDIDASVVVDPTLLLDKSEYEELCKDIDVCDTPYLMAFVLDDNDGKRRLIESEAKKLGLKVRYVFDGQRATLSIPQWLAAFREADAVITDSFHGTVFSMIFQKPFLTILNVGRGAARFDTLKQMLGIDRQIINDCNEAFESGPKIYDISSRLQQIQKQSMEFLSNSLA